jgi:hypothetical protein
MGAVGTRHFLRPLFSWGTGFPNSSGASRRESAELCLVGCLKLIELVRSLFTSDLEASYPSDLAAGYFAGRKAGYFAGRKAGYFAGRKAAACFGDYPAGLFVRWPGAKSAFAPTNYRGD